MTSRFVVVDGLNIVYRSFYAIRHLSTSAGRPTNAVYGFIKTIMQMERLWNPAYCLVVFDGGLPPERLKLLSSYKAQRPAMPEELREQLPSIEEYLDCASIPRIRLEQKEADDVIASAAVKAESHCRDVLIMTADKDLMQIISKNISLLIPGKADKKINSQEVFQKTGVTPAQIVDWLALTGDSSDNIPGVPGVGPKTAANWLRQFGSLNAIWTHLQELKPDRLRQALIDHLDIVERNVKLVKLEAKLNCFENIDQLKLRKKDFARLIHFFEQMEFHSLVKNLHNLFIA